MAAAILSSPISLLSTRKNTARKQTDTFGGNRSLKGQKSPSSGRRGPSSPSRGAELPQVHCPSFYHFPLRSSGFPSSFLPVQLSIKFVCLLRFLEGIRFAAASYSASFSRGLAPFHSPPYFQIHVSSSLLYPSPARLLLSPARYPLLLHN